jgi:hypothetical protein
MQQEVPPSGASCCPASCPSTSQDEHTVSLTFFFFFELGSSYVAWADQELTM